VQAGQRCAGRAYAISALVAAQTSCPCPSGFWSVGRWWRSSSRVQAPVGSAKGASIARRCQSAVVEVAHRNVAPAETSPSWAGRSVDKPAPSCALTPNDHAPGVWRSLSIGKVSPELKCARNRAETGSDSHDLAVRRLSLSDLARFVPVEKGGRFSLDSRLLAGEPNVNIHIKRDGSWVL